MIAACSLPRRSPGSLSMQPAESTGCRPAIGGVSPRRASDQKMACRLRAARWTLAVPHPLIARRTWLWRADSGEVIEALGFAPGTIPRVAGGNPIEPRRPAHGSPASRLALCTRDIVGLGPGRTLAGLGWSAPVHDQRERTIATDAVADKFQHFRRRGAACQALRCARYFVGGSG